MDPLLILRDLAGLGESQPVELDVTALPALAELDPELCYLGWKVRLDTGHTVEEIRDIFAFVEDGAEIHVEVVAWWVSW